MDDCLGELTLWGVGAVCVLLAVQYIVIPYWYIFLAIALAAGAVSGGTVWARRHAAKQRVSVRQRIQEFPQRCATDISDMIAVLNNSGSFSRDFDRMADEYLRHRNSLSDECRRLNRLAKRYRIPDRAKDPNRK